MTPPPNAPGRVRPWVSPRETAPDGRRRWRRPLRLGLRRFLPAGPKRLRCAACCRALNKRTRCMLETPGMVAGMLLPRGSIVCNTHEVLRTAPCPHCHLALFALEGPAFDGGALHDRPAFVDKAGAPLKWCVHCWKPLGETRIEQLAARVRRAHRSS